MKQSRLQSFIETNANVGIGFVMALAVQQWIVAPLFYPNASNTGKNIVVTVIFTAVSIVRGYLVRRYFNWRLHREPS